MSRRKLHLVGDFIMKQTVRVLFPRKFGDPASGYDLEFTCYAELDSNAPGLDRELLEQLFEEFNVGETSQVARAYRAKGLRSLSVGDVIVLDDEVAWLCGKAGWEPYDL